MSKYTDWMRHIAKVKKEQPFGPLQQFRNEEGRLHRDDGPAYISPTAIVSYQNGNKHGLSCTIYGTIIHYWDDVAIPTHYVENPEELQLDEVIAHPNVEVRAVGLRIIGFERLLREEKLDVVDIDKDSNRMLLKWNAPNSDESFCIVRVLNATVNHDGTRDTYFLMVPPDMKTCQEAVAWTFRETSETYAPAQES